MTCARRYDRDMTTSNLPTPPVDDKKLLATIETASEGSCCGGGACGGE
ncbi:hypothetical protein MTsN4n12_06730 [Microbacterium sp. MTN4-12]